MGRLIKLAAVVILATGCATREPPRHAGPEPEPPRRASPVVTDVLITVVAALAGVAFNRLLGK